MAKSPDERKDSWAEDVEKDPNALSKDKGSAESKCSNGDSSVSKKPNDNHKKSNISAEEQKTKESDKNDEDSDSSEEEFDSDFEKEGGELNWKEELHLREELIKLTLKEDAQSKTQTMGEVLQELSQDMRADSKWLFRMSSRLAVGAVDMMLKSDRLKALEVRKREESQLDPPLFESENLQVTDTGHSEKELKSKKDPLKCFYCHKEGHFRRECPERAASRGRRGWNQSRGGRNQARGGYRGRRGWYQPRDGWNQTRGTSGYKGIQIRDREGGQNRRPYVNDQYDERQQRPPYEYECTEQHWAGAYENSQCQSEFENERANHNPLN